LQGVAVGRLRGGRVHWQAKKMPMQGNFLLMAAVPDGGIVVVRRGTLGGDLLEKSDFPWGGESVKRSSSLLFWG